MDKPYVVEVTVEGRPNSGKTTVAMLIEKALKDYGFEVEANPRIMDFEDGTKVEDMSPEAYEKRKRHLFDDEFKKSLVPKRKIIIKQRAKRRFEDGEVER